MAKIEIIFPSASMSAGNINHNDLSGLEGLGPEYIHLNQDEYNNLDNILSNTLVNSVNGKTGDVILDYNDVNAAPTIHTHTISQITNLQSTLDSKQNNLVSGTNIKTIEGQTLLGSGNIDLSKTDVGLGNVDNTSDLLKPISNATQTVLNLKADDINVVHKTGDENISGVKSFNNNIQLAPGLQIATIGGAGGSMGLGNITDPMFFVKGNINAVGFNYNVGGASTGLFANYVVGATTIGGIRLDGRQFGSDAIVSNDFYTLGQANAALATKQDNLISGTSIKTIEGQNILGSGNIDLNKSDIGLANVDNTSDINKPVSTLQQAAINAKLAQTITDGITTSAPSQDAVFDALALKANKSEIIPQSNLVNSNIAEAGASISNGTKHLGFPLGFQTLSNKICFVYREGVGHLGNDGVTKLITSTDGGKTFTTGVTIISDPNYDCRNMSVGVTGTGRVIIFYAKYNNTTSTFISQQYIYSDDECLTWSSPVIITNQGGDFYSPYGQVIKIADGKLAMNFYSALSGTYRVFMLFSSDNGTTWGNPIQVISSNTIQHTEADFAYIGGSNIIGIIRPDNGTLYTQVKSNDNGQTWTSQGLNDFGKHAPWLRTYKESDGELYIAGFFTNRAAPNRGIFSVVGKASDILASVSGWQTSKAYFPPDTLPIHGDWGYTAAVNHNQENKFLVCYYAAVTATPTSASSLYFFNKTWNAVLDSKQTGTLTNGKVLIGNASNIATEQTLSGDVSITNTGVATVTNVIKTTTDQTKTGALTVQGQGNIVSNPVLGDLTGTISGVFRGALYGTSIGVRGNGNTFLQSQRIDGAVTTYNIELQPLSGQILIGQTASSTYKVDVAGTGRFTGTVVGATATLSTELATKGQMDTADGLKANIASPTFTGVPLSTTAAAGTNTTQIATTAFVTTALIALIKTGTSTQSGNGAILSFNIAHGLGVTPTYFNVNATAAASANISYVTANSTNITVFYTVAPATGTNNLTWNWITK